MLSFLPRFFGEGTFLPTSSSRSSWSSWRLRSEAVNCLENLRTSAPRFPNFSSKSSVTSRIWATDGVLESFLARFGAFEWGEYQTACWNSQYIYMMCQSTGTCIKALKFNPSLYARRNPPWLRWFVKQKARVIIFWRDWAPFSRQSFRSTLESGRKMAFVKVSSSSWQNCSERPCRRNPSSLSRRQLK